MLCTSALASIRSSRVSGNKMPFGVPLIEWPLRPTLCKNVAMLLGEENCTTRSTEPTSMPSSIDAVATSTLRLPALSRCSALCR